MKRDWTADELTAHWRLLPVDLTLLTNKSGPTRLGFAVLLKFFELEGRFPHDRDEVPTTVVMELARQVGVLPEHYQHYDWHGRTIKYHRAQIRAYCGFREVTAADLWELTRWLSEQIVGSSDRLEALQGVAYQGSCVPAVTDTTDWTAKRRANATRVSFSRADV